MEKRVLGAFGLIILTWIGYYYIIYPMYAPQRPAPVDRTVPQEQPRDFAAGDDPAGVYPQGETTGPAFDAPPDAARSAFDAPPDAAVTEPGRTPPPRIEDRPRQDPRQDLAADSWDRSERVLFLPPVEGAPAPREIVVENQYFRGVINTMGGVITSWKLKGYRGIGGEDVELIPPDRESGPDIVLTTERGPRSTRALRFAADRDAVVLGPGQSSGSVTLTADAPGGLTITKAFVINRDDYAVDLQVRIDGGQDLALGSKYYLRWGGGINVTERDWDQDLYAFRGFASLNDTVIDEDLGTEFEDPRPETTGETHWVGVRSKYFFTAMVPVDRKARGYRLNGRPVQRAQYDDRQIAAELSMGLASPLMDNFLLYLGPVHYDTLESYGYGLEGAVDLGWTIIQPISRITLISLVWLHQFITNYGVVIIVLSIIVKILLFPLTHKSMKATQGMAALQPKMESLKEKHKNDSTKLNQEMMKLYRDAGVNPLGGCLPLLLQMPILIALYTIFSSTIELRDAPFIGWIQDLSLRDPYYVLPVLMAATMLIQSKMTMKDPRQAMFVYIMPAVLFFIMMNLPSGLILYWTMINVLTIVQQAFQNRFFPVQPAK